MTFLQFKSDTEPRDPPDRSESAAPWIRAEFVVRRLDVLSAALVLLTITSYLGTLHWLLELTTHFRVQYAIGAVVIGTAYLLLKKYIRAGALGAVFVVHAMVILPLHLPAEQNGSAPQSGKTLKIMSINVHTSNRNSDGVLELVREEKPDLLLLMEVDHRWIRELNPLTEMYSPHRAVPRPDNFGIALYSRRPLDEINVRTETEKYVPVITARFKHDGQVIHFTGLHTLPPASPSYSANRNKLLSEIAEDVANTSGPTIVMGDLNTTSWSPYFQSFVRQSGLNDSRKGFGIQPTWPSSGALFPLLIPVDHCLVSDDLTVVNRRVLRDIGSDHYPIMVSLTVDE